MRYPRVRLHNTGEGRPMGGCHGWCTFLEVLARPEDAETPPDGPPRRVWKPPKEPS